MRAGGDDLAIGGIDRLSCLVRAAAGDFLDFGERVDLVARVDALGAVAAEKVVVEPQPTDALQYGNADFFSCAWIYSGLVNNDVTHFEGLRHGFAGFDEGCHVRPIGLVHRGWHSHDKDVAGMEIVRLAAEPQLSGCCQVLAAAFQGVIPAGLQFCNSGRGNVKS